MQEVSRDPLPLDVIVATKDDVVTVELDVRHNGRARVGDQYVAHWDDGRATILRIIGFQSAEDYSNTIARRTDAMRERVVGVPRDMSARKAYQIKLAQMRVQGEVLPDGSRVSGATRLPDVMVPVERITDDLAAKFGTNPEGNLALGTLRSGMRTLPRSARINQNFAGERMIILGRPGKGKSQLVRSFLSQLMAEDHDQLSELTDDTA